MLLKLNDSLVSLILVLKESVQLNEKKTVIGLYILFLYKKLWFLRIDWTHLVLFFSLQELIDRQKNWFPFS